MTVGGYNMGGDLDICARETDRAKFIASVQKLAKQRNVSDRTLMLWCYQRADSVESLERIKSWIQEEDASGKWLMSLNEFEYVFPSEEEDSPSESPTE